MTPHEWTELAQELREGLPEALGAAVGMIVIVLGVCVVAAGAVGG